MARRYSFRLGYVLPLLLATAALYYYVTPPDLIMSSSPAPGETGADHQVTVIDGDSLTVNNRAIRLFGIDAPEYHQICSTPDGDDYPCGKQAAQALRKIIGQQPITCVEIEEDRYHRAVSICTSGNKELNAEMVRQGWAVAYTQYSLDYVTEEEEAHKAGRGLWSGTFTFPDAYRKTHPRIKETGAAGQD